MDNHDRPNGHDNIRLPLASATDPASALVEVDLAALTHPGHLRVRNEDHYLAARFGRSLETLSSNITEGLLDRSFDEVGYGMVVADGMGGMSAGDVASRTALSKFVELVVNTPDWFLNVARHDDMATVMRRMTERFRRIDDELRERAQNNQTLLGMGTTLTMAVSLSSNLLVGHIGDSRAYLLRNNSLHQLTRDDTLAQALIDAGIADPEDAATRAMRHVLTAAIGSTGEPVDPQVKRVHLCHGDRVLLCTDGLPAMVKDEAIADALIKADSASDACAKLIALALGAGGVDNVTVVLAHYKFPS